jgi:hypothetical protein
MFTGTIRIINHNFRPMTTGRGKLFFGIGGDIADAEMFVGQASICRIADNSQSWLAVGWRTPFVHWDAAEVQNFPKVNCNSGRFPDSVQEFVGVSSITSRQNAPNPDALRGHRLKKSEKVLKK